MEHLLTCVWRLPRVNGVVGLRLIEMLTLQFINSTAPRLYYEQFIHIYETYYCSLV